MPDCCPLCRTELVPGSRFCHECGAPLTGLQPRLPGKSEVRVARVLIAATCLGWVIAWLSTFIADATAASIIGLLNVGVSLVMIVLGVQTRYTWAWTLGATHCAFYLLCVVLVAMFGWGPSTAKWPFLVIGGFYLAETLPLSIYAWRHLPPTPHPWECKKCGYLLYGLSKPRCPECGLPFDPAKVTPPMPPGAQPPPGQGGS